MSYAISQLKAIEQSYLLSFMLFLVALIMNMLSIKPLLSISSSILTHLSVSLLHANPPRHETNGTLQCVGLDEVGSGKDGLGFYLCKRFVSLVSIYTKITRDCYTCDCYVSLVKLWIELKI